MSVAPFAELVKNSPTKHDASCNVNAKDGKFQCNHEEESPSFMQNESLGSPKPKGVNSFKLDSIIQEVPFERPVEPNGFLDSQAGGGDQDEQGVDNVHQVRMMLNINRQESKSVSNDEDKTESIMKDVKEIELSNSSSSISVPDRRTSEDYNIKQLGSNVM